MAPKLAAQQHELTLTRHYEALLLARESQSLTTDLTSNTNTSQAFQRLSKNLRALLRSMAGEDPEDQGVISNFPNQNEDSAETTESEQDFQVLLQALDEEGAGGYAGTEGREDWALERECEIARLEKENEELRRLLGIDPPSLEENGIKVDEESVAQLGSKMVFKIRRGSVSVGGDTVGGMGSGTGTNTSLGTTVTGEGYGQRSANSAFTIGDANVNGNGNNHYQQIGTSLQRALEIQPAMRLQQRRVPPMFPRGGGNLRGGNPGSNLWPEPRLPDRPW